MTVADGERLAQIREEWLRPCGACDGGLSMNCTHPKEDPRAVIGELFDTLDAARAENERLRQQPAGTEFLRQLEIALDTVKREYDAVHARAQRAEAGLETSHNVKVAQATVIGQQNLTIAGLSRERDAANAALARVRAVHNEVPVESAVCEAWCESCAEPAPCPTIRALYGEPAKEGDDG